MNQPQSHDLAQCYAQHLTTPHPHRPNQARAGSSTRRRLAGPASSWAQRTAPAWDQLAATPLSSIWVWSDLHLGHANIVHLAKRDFPDVEAMNEHLLSQAQALVPPNDWLVFVGDVSFRHHASAAWLARCPGRKALILGNHDIDRIHQWHAWGMDAVAATWEQPIAHPSHPHISTLWWTHYPLDQAAIPAQTLNVHGHIHRHRLSGPWINACVEHQNMAPERLDHRLARWSPDQDAPRLQQGHMMG